MTQEEKPDNYRAQLIPREITEGVDDAAFRKFSHHACYKNEGSRTKLAGTQHISDIEKGMYIY